MSFDPSKYLIKIKGKDYLETKWRIVWFNDVHPKGSITTELLEIAPIAVFKCSVYDSDGVLLATGHGSATPKPNSVYAGRELEKAETAAIGRALAHAGFGTQFAEDDEGDYLADSPVEPAPRPAQPRKPAEPTPEKGAPAQPLNKVNKKLHLDIIQATDALWGKKDASAHRHQTVSLMTLTRTENVNELSEDEAITYLQMVRADAIGREIYQNWQGSMRTELVEDYSNKRTTNLYKMTLNEVNDLLQWLNDDKAGDKLDKAG